MKVVVAGAGHIGMALAALLALRNDVTLVDVDPCKVDAINAGAAVSDEQELAELLGKSCSPLRATLDGRAAYAEADYVIVAVHTDFDDSLGMLDTAQVDQVVGLVAEVNPSAVVAVKSTLPVGYTDGLHGRFPAMRLLYCPEFLREGREAHDCLNPTRIVVGVPDVLLPDSGSQVDAPTRDELLDEARCLAAMLIECSLAGAGDGADVGEDANAPDGVLGIPVFIMSAAEAEAVKLFSNAYLAMRVAYFNELDGFCEARGLEAYSVVRAVCADPRIGDYYNNPSFGYGGGCLPKDSRQLLANFGDAPHALARAIVELSIARSE